MANIFSRTLKQSSSSHCRFSVASGSERHKVLKISKFIASGRYGQEERSNLLARFAQGQIQIDAALAAIDGDPYGVPGAMIIHDLVELLLVLNILAIDRNNEVTADHDLLVPQIGALC